MAPRKDHHDRECEDLGWRCPDPRVPGRTKMHTTVTTRAGPSPPLPPRHRRRRRRRSTEALEQPEPADTEREVHPHVDRSRRRGLDPETWVGREPTRSALPGGGRRPVVPIVSATVVLAELVIDQDPREIDPTGVGVRRLSVARRTPAGPVQTRRVDGPGAGELLHQPARVQTCPQPPTQRVAAMPVTRPRRSRRRRSVVPGTSAALPGAAGIADRVRRRRVMANECDDRRDDQGRSRPGDEDREDRMSYVTASNRPPNPTRSRRRRRHDRRENVVKTPPPAPEHDDERHGT